MGKNRLLFTPGPLTTSEGVKCAMLRDIGSRDGEFIDLVRGIRRRLLEIGQVADGSYEAVLMQGSGTFAIESVVSSVIPSEGKLLVLVNGAYGRRIARIAETLRIDCSTLDFAEADPVDPKAAAEILDSDRAITHVSTVHCETSTGILNPIAELGAVARRLNKVFIVDAMSSFGGMMINVRECGVDFLVSSANKCIQGVPGFGFVLARRDLLRASEGRARSVSLDLVAQWKGLESDGQFRFTPPTHALLAFQQALIELEEEGGVAARMRRYAANQNKLLEGMRRLGFECYLPPTHQSPIISSFRYPRHPNFSFESFYERLKDLGFVIYPGKVSDADCFRVGTIGHIFPSDITNLLTAIRTALEALRIDITASV